MSHWRSGAGWWWRLAVSHDLRYRTSSFLTVHSWISSGNPCKSTTHDSSSSLSMCYIHTLRRTQAQRAPLSVLGDHPLLHDLTKLWRETGSRLSKTCCFPDQPDYWRTWTGSSAKKTECADFSCCQVLFMCVNARPCHFGPSDDMCIRDEFEGGDVFCPIGTRGHIITEPVNLGVRCNIWQGDSVLGKRLQSWWTWSWISRAWGKTPDNRVIPFIWNHLGW